MLCWFLLYSKVHQLYVYLYALLIEFPSHLGHHKVLNKVLWDIQQVHIRYALYIVHLDITRWSTPKSDWLYSLQPKIEKRYTVSKNKTGADCGSDHEHLIDKLRLKLKKVGKTIRPFSSVQFSHSVMSNSLQPHGLQHTRPTCPSPSPEVCPNSCPSHRWCHPETSSLVPSCPSALNLSQHQGLF